MITLKYPEHLENIRKAGKIASTVLSALPFYLKAGATTEYIDKVCDQIIRDHGGTASCKGYTHGNLPPYPGSICISINEEAVHCVPSKRVLKDGDIVKVDLVVNYKGWNADTARTYLIAPVNPEVQKFVETCYLSMWEGLKKSVDGNKTTDIGKAIEDFVKPSGYGIVIPFIGHGIGKNIHEEPPVPNYYFKEKEVLLCSGMTICVEPILTFTKESEILIDGWNTHSKNGALVSHFEHTCLITAGKPEIITLRDEEKSFLSNLL